MIRKMDKEYQSNVNLGKKRRVELVTWEEQSLTFSKRRRQKIYLRLKYT